MFELGFFDSLFWCVGFACIPLLIILLLKGKNLFLTISSILSSVVIAINLSLAVDAKWMAFLNDFVKDWTSISDYVFYFALLFDVVSAVILLFFKKDTLNKKIFGIFAITNLALVLSSNVFNFYTCGVNYHLLNPLSTQTADMLALICTFVLYLRLIVTAGLTLTLILVKTPQQKQQQMEELKQEIIQLVDDIKEELHEQKQQQEFNQMVKEISNDKEFNDLLDQIEEEIALAEQHVETQQQEQAQEQPQEQAEVPVEVKEQEQTQVESTTTPQTQETDTTTPPIKQLSLIKEFEVQPATHLITATDTTEERTTQTLEIIEEVTNPNDSSKKEMVVVATTAPKSDSTTQKSRQPKKDAQPTVKKFVAYIVESELESEAPNMYCQNCGTKVHSESEICPRCFNQMTHLYLCKNCHTLNAQTTCENCGEKLD